jgi:hypothetical protein
MWARIHLMPVLQAEEDRDMVRRYLADQAREKELLGKNIQVYHSDRLVSCRQRTILASSNTSQICKTDICCHTGAPYEIKFCMIDPKASLLNAILAQVRNRLFSHYFGHFTPSRRFVDTEHRGSLTKTRHIRNESQLMMIIWKNLSDVFYHNANVTS